MRVCGMGAIAYHSLFLFYSCSPLSLNKLINLHALIHILQNVSNTKYTYLTNEPVRHFFVSTFFTGYAESIIAICTDKTCAIKFPKTVLTKHENNYSLPTSFSSYTK